jgi:hypothetical protein
MILNQWRVDVAAPMGPAQAVVGQMRKVLFPQAWMSPSFGRCQ